MIDLHLNLFGVILDLSMIFPKRKKKVQKAEEVVPNEEKPNNEKTPSNISEFLCDLEEYNNVNNAQIKLTEIENQALKYEEELKNTILYDIPDNSDLPKKHQIQDDVEVITESFEKELEDLYEGRR